MNEELNEVEAVEAVGAIEGVEELNTELPMCEGEKKDERIYKLEDGTICSRSAFVRAQFIEHNLGRKDISEKFDIPYRAVYSATVNMENDAEPATRGRAVMTKLNVTTEGKHYVKSLEDGTFEINGEIFANLEGIETEVVDRNEWIEEKVVEGASRGDLSKLLEISYGVVYNATKEMASASQKHMVELEDGTTISRSEYIRQLVAGGKTKGDIAKELDVEYSVVWQATKQLKSTSEKFETDVTKLEKYLDLVENPDDLQKIIDACANIVIKADAADAVTEESTEETTAE